MELAWRERLVEMVPIPWRLREEKSANFGDDAKVGEANEGGFTAAEREETVEEEVTLEELEAEVEEIS